MSKITEIIAKISPILNVLKAKLPKGSAPRADSPAKPNPIKKLWIAYKEGSTFTRLQVLVICIGFLIGLYSLGQMGIQLVRHKQIITKLVHRGTEKYDKMEEYLKRQADIKHDISSTVSLDRIRINSVRDNGTKGFISISIWVKCDSPQTARVVQDVYPRLHDAIIGQIQEVYESEITTELGKKKLQERMRTVMNAAMHSGRIDEIFFHNLIFE